MLKVRLMLFADNISILFGDERVLHRFSCHVERGAFACITGVSGCGKTSLLRSFLGLTPLAEGEIRVGQSVLSEDTCSVIRKQIAYLPQDLALPYGKVDEVVRQVLKIGGLRSMHSSMRLLRENMRKLGIDEELLDKRVVEISGGQRQRLMLAVLSLLERDVWLLDEPTAALDAASRDYVIDFLIEQQRNGKTIVVVSHDPCFCSKCTKTIQLK